MLGVVIPPERSLTRVLYFPSSGHLWVSFPWASPPWVFLRSYFMLAVAPLRLGGSIGRKVNCFFI